MKPWKMWTVKSCGCSVTNVQISNCKIVFWYQCECVILVIGTRFNSLSESLCYTFQGNHLHTAHLFHLRYKEILYLNNYISKQIIVLDASALYDKSNSSLSFPWSQPCCRGSSCKFVITNIMHLFPGPKLVNIKFSFAMPHAGAGWKPKLSGLQWSGRKV